MSVVSSAHRDADVAIDLTLVQSLAREYRRPEGDVERILREEMDRISSQARINTFVAVLATSCVRTRLRTESRSR